MFALSEAEYSAYKQDGFIGVARQLFSESDFERLKKLTIETHQKAKPNTICLTNLPNYNPLFLKWAARPEILKVLEPILGPDIGLFATTMFYKKANTQDDVDWHRDSEYVRTYNLFDDVKFASVVIAITDANIENGCLEFIKKSHLSPVFRSFTIDQTQKRMFVESAQEKELIKKEVAQGEKVNVNLKKGEFSLHDADSLHGSGPNKSSQDRILLNFKYFPTYLKSNATELKEKHNMKQTMFLVKGKDLSGCCDISLTEA
jgi:non-haem Fe2+, alpha-ketoglutarate-dependent halogenase